MNEIIALNGGVLLNPSGIQKYFHVLTQGVGIRLDPVLSCMDPAGIEDAVQRNRALLFECLTRHYSISDNNDNTLYLSAIG